MAYFDEITPAAANGSSVSDTSNSGPSGASNTTGTSDDGETD